MTPLVLALIAPILVAVLFGGFIGASIVYAKQEIKTGEHPLLDIALAKRNPILNMCFALLSWALLLYGVPKVSFWLVGIEDTNAYGISAGCQLVALFGSMLISERIWARIL